MTHTSSRFFPLTSEDALYLLPFSIGLLIRLAQLGDAPLGDGEAQAALQALAMARGEIGTLFQSSGQPLYTILTALVFYLIKDSNALARAVPALLGSFLTLLPWIAVKVFPSLRTVGRWTGLFLAFGLALDPGLVLLSRSTAGNIPGIFFTLLAVLGVAAFISPTAAIPRKTAAVLTGAAVGAALLSGPTLWIGLLILAFTLLVIFRRRFQKDNRPTTNQPFHITVEIQAFLIAALVTIASLIMIGPVFLGSPFDLSGLGSSLLGFVERLAQPSGIPALRLLATLAVYHPLALIFGTIGALRSYWLPLPIEENQGDSNAVGRTLSLVALIALLIVLLLPGREMSDLFWVLIPLYALAAMQLSTTFDPWINSRPGALLTATGVYTFLYMMFGLNLINLTTMWANLLERFGQAGALAQVMIIVAALGLMIVIVSALFWLYWSPRLMISALSLSTTFVLLLALIGSTWSLTRLRPDSNFEFWRASPSHFSTPGQLVEIYHTLSQAAILETSHRPSGFNTGGVRSEMEVVLLDPLSSSPALNWALRSFSLSNETALGPEESAGAVLTTALLDPVPARLASAYRGQDLIWQFTPVWSSALPPAFLPWLLEREAPQDRQSLILWVRVDLFPGGQP
jgi:hypothetical protein